MPFGAKTVATFVKEVTENVSCTSLDCSSNPSFKGRSTQALDQLAQPLIGHASIKSLNLSDCAICDDGCSHLAKIIRANHVIEELILSKNNISQVGMRLLADALAENKGIKTLNVLGQVYGDNKLGEDTLDHFLEMFKTNITLCKIIWHIQSSTADQLNKLQTRNIEIQKRSDKGEEYNKFLPSGLRAKIGGCESAAEEIVACKSVIGDEALVEQEVAPVDAQ